MFKLYARRRPQAQSPAPSTHPPVEVLPEVFAPPEVVHGAGDDSDWALWDECVAAFDAQVRSRTAQEAANEGSAAA